MKIGIDLRALQTGHKYRGIGEVAKQVTNRILELSAQADDKLQFIFYEYDDDDPKKLLNVPSGIDYETVKLGFMPEGTKSNRSKKEKILDALKKLYGKPIKDSYKSDVFLQFDYAFGVPNDTKTFLMFHDLIPYVFWNDFFESPMIPFKNRALRTTLRTIYANESYIKILKRGLNNAYKILAISENTKSDLVKRLGIKASKIDVIYLGVDKKPVKTNLIKKEKNTKPTKPYLFFIGAGDERRRVDDLISAFNNLKAEGKDIQLVLAGENFQKSSMIPNKRVRDAVMKSSYKRDILTVGYVSDEDKQNLYKNAIAFVYPTKYEGFGLPILESMMFKCPIITYNNSSTYEIGKSHAIYAKDWYDIKNMVECILGWKPKDRSKWISSAEEYAYNYSWDDTANKIYNKMIN